MTTTLEIIFAAGCALLAYAYFVFPLILILLAAASRPDTADKSAAGGADSAAWPSISVLVAAYNEEGVIAEKVRNFLASDYPGPSEIIIVSDGSTDRTADVVRELAGDRVRMVELPARSGKGVAINTAVPMARGDLLAFTDANTFFAADTLRELARPFADPRIGLVTGCTRYPDGSLGSAYQRYEQMLKQLESKIGTIATADGAIYAMRRRLWREHDPALINDFLHPMMIGSEGFDAILAPGAVCFEEFDIGNEFRRQVRMVSQAARVYFAMMPVMLRRGAWRSAFVVTSHKFLRWLTALILLLLLGTTIALAPSGHFYQSALASEVLFALLALAGAVGLSAGGAATLAYRFVELTWAQTVGLWQFFRGQVPVVWQPRGSEGD
jgi:cellulose synthase/poly-beta-1,6-N-acetylglucosamine synthase-like glycosyltransferase